MYKQKIEEQLKSAVLDLGFVVTDIVLSISENSQFGDYTSNIALQLSNQKHQNSYQSPKEIANALLEKFGHPDYLERVEVAGPGFLNFFIKDEKLIDVIPTVMEGSLDFARDDKREINKKYLVEYGHTNPLKEIHIGHLRTFILGESICRLLATTGHEVFRANYQGDIGLHIAKAIWGIKQIGLPSEDLESSEKAKFMGQAYAKGNSAYEDDEQIKREIDEINIKLYKKDPELQQVYKLARDWSLEYFEPIYELLGIKYDRCFFESEVYEQGKKTVLENVSKVFDKDDGAIIFKGEKYGLHTRVFVTSAGNPTYEGKEIGLAELEYNTFPYDKSIHVVANEQQGYFEVVFKAIELIFPYLKDKKYHLSYGFVDLKEGKMSSRTGNVITVDDLLGVVSEKVREIFKSSDREIDQIAVKKIALSAIKFNYLKFSSASNFVFDLEESVSLHGDSGPYLQYAYARIQSLLNRAGLRQGYDLQAKEVIEAKDDSIAQRELENKEREVLRLLEYFETVVEKAALELKPNELSTYLLNLGKAFNSFYESHPILGTKEQDFRLKLSQKVGETLKTGLYLLGIETVERM